MIHKILQINIQQKHLVIPGAFVIFGKKYYEIKPQGYTIGLIAGTFRAFVFGHLAL